MGFYSLCTDYPLKHNLLNQLGPSSVIWDELLCHLLSFHYDLLHEHRSACDFAVGVMVKCLLRWNAWNCWELISCPCWQHGRAGRMRLWLRSSCMVRGRFCFGRTTFWAATRLNSSRSRIMIGIVNFVFIFRFTYSLINAVCGFSVTCLIKRYLFWFWD